MTDTGPLALERLDEVRHLPSLALGSQNLMYQSNLSRIRVPSAGAQRMHEATHQG